MLAGPGGPRAPSLRPRRPRPLRHIDRGVRPGVVAPRQHHVLDLWDHLPRSTGRRQDSRRHRTPGLGGALGLVPR
jgi:hypothetical protein